MSQFLLAPNQTTTPQPGTQPEQKQKGMFLSFLTNAIGNLRQPAGVGYNVVDTNSEATDQQNTFVAYGILFALVIAGFYLITKIK